MRRTRSTDCRPKLHHGLVEIAGTRSVEQAFGPLPVLFGSAHAAKHAVEHALHIAIDHSDWLAERDARDRSRSVTADAGKLPPAFGCPRKLSGALADDSL